MTESGVTKLFTTTIGSVTEPLNSITFSHEVKKITESKTKQYLVSKFICLISFIFLYFSYFLYFITSYNSRIYTYNSLKE